MYSNSLQKLVLKKVEHGKKLDVKEQQSLKHNVQPVKQHTYESKDKKDQSIHANKSNYEGNAHVLLKLTLVNKI